MLESTTLVIVGPDVEIWSLSRCRGGFSCLRTIHAATAARAWAALAVAGLDARLNTPQAIDLLLLHLPLSQPSASAAAWVVVPMQAVEFFAAGRSGEAVQKRARRLVRDVAPILSVAA